jgi:hypothetical protein
MTKSELTPHAAQAKVRTVPNHPGDMKHGSYFVIESNLGSRSDGFVPTMRWHECDVTCKNAEMPLLSVVLCFRLPITHQAPLHRNQIPMHRRSLTISTDNVKSRGAVRDRILDKTK